MPVAAWEVETALVENVHDLGDSSLKSATSRGLLIPVNSSPTLDWHLASIVAAAPCDPAEHQGRELDRADRTLRSCVELSHDPEGWAVDEAALVRRPRRRSLQSPGGPSRHESGSRPAP